MYEEFYDLRVKPFQVVPDPAFLYWSESHSMAFTMLRYSIMNASPLAETHFMFAGVCIHIDLRGIHFEEQHIGRMPAMEQNV